MPEIERIREMLHDVTGMPAELLASEPAAQLALDPLDKTELIMNMEEEFGILVDDEESIVSVADLLDCLRQIA